ncbi:KPN_02809 family neutral zinc metallopeptidase [Roseimaritima ulvae]|uniref:Neutral zinc metallopeptidase n=1 Tax=Roseimaritima ulvae TaxID=980254 RepID=A0A5B9QP23_9BACT|nr:neutral zinc metallopeptidase [Roseimaritima ulvae]QEG39699.1 Putative neutral zinc metallopeptidase [Roseimaritima ulvae]
MRLGGRRQSEHVDDRRRRRAAPAAAGGVGLLLMALVVWMMGGNPLQVLQNAPQGGGQAVQQGGQQVGAELTAEEQAAGEFASTILASTEDVWTPLFAQSGKTYRPAEMVLFRDAVQSACGNASSATGPFYCPADEKVYLDTSFFDQMARQLNAPGDFAQAYVIAHEVGHHVQNLMGRTDWMEQQRRRVSKTEYNRLSVRLELQADYYAGVWAHHEQARFGSLEEGDIREGLDAANAIGDDRLQRQATGRVVPDSFTHGTSEQRLRWFAAGLESGDLSGADTFSMPYERL